jgi:hypothetical protein
MLMLCMQEHPSGESALFRFWRGWRRDIIRGVAVFTIIVASGAAASHVFRSHAGGWPDLAGGGDGWGGGGWGGGGSVDWRETFRFTHELKPGQKVWIRNRSGAVIVAAAAGESLLVVADKGWHHSSPEMVDIVAIPHEGGVTICALWDARSAHCRPKGEYEVSKPKRSDVMVRFMIHVPHGVAVDASTENGLLEIRGVDGPAVARTVNGKVHATVVRAPFSASTVNGEIHAEVAPRPGTRAGDISFETVNGAIMAALAPGLNAELEASTVNGRIETDYPVAVNGKLTSRRLAARLGAGGPSLRLSAVNGSIKLTELHHSDHEAAGGHSPKPPVPPRAPRTRAKS